MKENLIGILRDKADKILFDFGNEYISLVQQYKNVMENENYSDVYKEKKKIEILEKVRTGRSAAYKKALDLVDKERREDDKKRKSYDRMSVEEKTLIALEKNNLIHMATMEVKGASTDKLRNLIIENNYDKDIKTIVQAELNSRFQENKSFKHDEKVLSMELRIDKDVFGIVEQQLTSEMANEDRVRISYGNVRSIKKSFDMEPENYYFNDDNKNTKGGSIPKLTDGAGVRESNYF